MNLDDRNVVLIGMAGAGKSTVGAGLANAMSRPFIDTDAIIEAAEGRTLQEIVDAEGLLAFARIEERHVLALDVRGHVIATGGSVVYSEAAMGHLKAAGALVHLDLDFAHVRRRITNLHKRGFVMQPGQTLQEVFAEREPLYQRWADLTVDCDGKPQRQIIDEILRGLKSEG